MTAATTEVDRFIKIRGCEIFYRRVGRGRPTLVVHGGMVLDGSNFLPHLGSLADFLDMIIYDQCGRGRSTDRNGEDLTTASIWDDVEDLEGIRKAMSLGKINVIGHSWGGIIAGLFASRNPTAIDKLVMVAPVGARYLTWQKPWIKNTIDMLPERNRAQFEAVLGDRELRKKDPLAYFTNYFASIHPSWFGDQSWASKVPIHKVRTHTGLAVWDSLKGYDVRNYISAIECPTLIVQGTKDAIPQTSTKEIQDLIKGSRLELIEGVGHYPFIEANERFTQLVREFIG